MQELPNFKWYILKVTKGKEQSTCQNIVERLQSYGLDEYVKNLQIINVAIEDKKVVKPNDLPKDLNSTSVTTWSVDDAGTYTKVTRKDCNKWPGFCFINMIFNPDA